MGMIRAGVDLQLAQLLDAQLGPRQHPLDRAANDLFGSPLEEVTEGLLLVALGMTAVADVELRLALVAGHFDLRGIEDDDVVTGIEVRRIGRLVLALENARNPRGEPAERPARRVDDEPASFDLALTDRVCLRVHRSSIVSVGASGSPSEDDSPETEALRRGGCPIEGRSSSGECRPDVRLIQFSATDLQDDGNDSADPSPQEGVGPDFDRHELTRPADPDRVNGPNRLPVRRPEGAEVVSADEDRPGLLHRGGVERDPDPERDALAEWAPRPVPDGVAILPVARRVTRVERGGGTPDVADGKLRREERIERPPQLLHPEPAR